MQCCNHNHNQNQKKGKGHSPLGHALMMILCCGLPIILIWLLPSIVSVFPAAVGLSAIIPFLCPIMMIPMLFMMFKGNGHSHDGCGRRETREPAAVENGGPDKE